MSEPTTERSPFFTIAYGLYVGEVCRYCGHEYTSIEDLDACDVVWAWSKDIDPPISGKGQTIACKSCWLKQHPLAN